ncbi:MAG: phosphoglycerate kinase, partial [Byssovorax sp.]
MKLTGIRSIEELNKGTGENPALFGKRVFIRVDFNCPLDKKTGQITDDARIREAIPTIKYAM